MNRAELVHALQVLPAGASLTLSREALLEVLGADLKSSSVEGLTVAQLGERLSRRPSTVRGWCERGLLPGAYRLQGREWRIPAAAVESFLDSARGQGQRVATRAPALGAWRRVTPERGPLAEAKEG